MSVKEIRTNFLTEEEIRKLNQRENGSKDGRLLNLKATMLDPCLKEYTLSMKKWSVATNTYKE